MIERWAEAPHTNRGVENTSKYPLIVDWVTFSGHFQTFQEMIEFLGLKAVLSLKSVRLVGSINTP